MHFFKEEFKDDGYCDLEEYSQHFNMLMSNEFSNIYFTIRLEA